MITSYTLPWLSKAGVKVWLAGSIESRAERMSRRDGIPVKECKKIIAVRDQENYRIYMKLYDISFGEDLSRFDLVIGTDAIPAAEVAESVLRQIRKLAK